MARFERPAGAIANYADLKVGDQLWEVFGIWPPFLSGPFEIVSTPGPFRTHREYSDIHAAQAEQIVFDYKWSREDGRDPFVSMAFASDGNLVPGESYNHNYWFQSKDDASAAVSFLRAEWEKRPDLISEATARREELIGWSYDCVDCDLQEEA